MAITTLLVAGIYYFILHKDRSTFSGIDLNTPEGKHRIVKAIRSLAAMMFHQADNARMAVDGNNLHEVEAYRRRFEDACGGTGKGPRSCRAETYRRNTPRRGRLPRNHLPLPGLTGTGCTITDISPGRVRILCFLTRPGFYGISCVHKAVPYRPHVRCAPAPWQSGRGWRSCSLG